MTKFEFKAMLLSANYGEEDIDSILLAYEEGDLFRAFDLVIEGKESQMEDVEDERDDLEHQVNDLEYEVDDLEGRVEELEQEAEEAS